MKIILRLSVLVLVTLAVTGTEAQQDRRRMLFNTRNRQNILSRRFNPEGDSTPTTTPAPEEKTTTVRTRVRLPPRRPPSLRFGIRPAQPSKTKVEFQQPEKEEKAEVEAEVISEPQPGQEYVAISADKVSPKFVEEKAPEPEILVEPVPGEEFVAVKSSFPRAQESVITAEDGELVYVGIESITEDSAPENKTQETPLPEEEVALTPEAEQSADLDAILITPDEILPIEEVAPVTEVIPDDFVEVTEANLGTQAPHEPEQPVVTPTPLKNATALEPELETLISVVTSLPTKEVEGESMHVKHHMEFEHSHIGPENETLIEEEPTAVAEPVPEVPIPEVEPVAVPVTEYFYDYDFGNSTNDEHFLYDSEGFESPILETAPFKDSVQPPLNTEPHDIEANISSHDVFTETPVDTTELPIIIEEHVSDIEILSSSPKDQQNLPVNDLYGKYFDESDLDFGKGANSEDKLLFPAETEQKVRSKIEIKEVNGQLYEYEYIYYYDDEYPLYDYEDGAPIDVEPTTAPAIADTTTTNAPSTTTTTTTTTTTPPPTTTTPTTTTIRSSRGSVRGNIRGRSRHPVVDDHEVNVIEEPVRSSFGRQRETQSQPTRTSSRTRGSIRSREEEIHSFDNTVHDVTVEEDKLPAQTRFPPRITTTVAPTRSRSRSRSREREPLFKETSQVGIDEQKQIPFIQDVTGSQSPQGRQSSRGGRKFDAGSQVFESTTELSGLEAEELTTEVTPTSTLLPSALSAANLYALSQAADPEEMGDATTQIPAAYDYDTEIPVDYQEFYYEYDTATEYPSSPLEVDTEIPGPQTEPEPSAEPEPEPEPEPSTEEPTTSTSTSTTTTTTTTTTTPAPTTTTTTTTTTEASRTRGRFDYRNRGASRFSSRSQFGTSTTEEPQSNSAPAQGTRFRPSRFGSTRPGSSNRFQSSSSSADEQNSENTVDSESAGETETRTTSVGNRSRFNRPRISSFRSQSSTEAENEVRKPTPSTPPATRQNSRVRTRPTLLRNRFRGKATTEELVSTEPTVNEAAEAVESPVEEKVIEETEGELEISTESAVSPSTAASPTNFRTRLQSKNRHRFGSRRPSSSQSQPDATTSEDENTNDANEAPVQPQNSRSPSRPRVRPTRPLTLRRGPRPGLRNRGTTSTETPVVAEEGAPVDETNNETQGVEEQPTAEGLTEQDTAIDNPEEPTSDTESSSPTSPQRGINNRRRSNLRFRNRSQTNAQNTPKPPPKKEEPTASPQRRGGLSSLFSRRRKGRPGSPSTEATQAPEEETPIDESHSADGTQAADAQPTEVEDDLVADEVVPVSETEAEVVEETPAEDAEPAKEEPPKRRFSFLNRRRNRN